MSSDSTLKAESVPLTEEQAIHANGLYDSLSATQADLFRRLEIKYNREIDFLYDYPSHMSEPDIAILAAYDAAQIASRDIYDLKTYDDALAAIKHAEVTEETAHQSARLSALVSLLPKMIDSYIVDIRRSQPDVNSLQQVETIKGSLSAENQARYEALINISVLLNGQTDNTTSAGLNPGALASVFPKVMASAKLFLDLTNGKVDAAGNSIDQNSTSKVENQGSDSGWGQFSNFEIYVGTAGIFGPAEKPRAKNAKDIHLAENVNEIGLVSDEKIAESFAALEAAKRRYNQNARGVEEHMTVSVKMAMEDMAKGDSVQTPRRKLDPAREKAVARLIDKLSKLDSEGINSNTAEKIQALVSEHSQGESAMNYQVMTPEWKRFQVTRFEESLKSKTTHGILSESQLGQVKEFELGLEGFDGIQDGRNVAVTAANLGAQWGTTKHEVDHFILENVHGLTGNSRGIEVTPLNPSAVAEIPLSPNHSAYTASAQGFFVDELNAGTASLNGNIRQATNLASGKNPTQASLLAAMDEISDAESQINSNLKIARTLDQAYQSVLVKINSGEFSFERVISNGGRDHGSKVYGVIVNSGNVERKLSFVVNGTATEAEAKDILIKIVEAGKADLVKQLESNRAHQTYLTTLSLAAQVRISLGASEGSANVKPAIAVTTPAENKMAYMFDESSVEKYSLTADVMRSAELGKPKDVVELYRSGQVVEHVLGFTILSGDSSGGITQFRGDSPQLQYGQLVQKLEALKSGSSDISISELISDLKKINQDMDKFKSDAEFAKAKLEDSLNVGVRSNASSSYGPNVKEYFVEFQNQSGESRTLNYALHRNLTLSQAQEKMQVYLASAEAIIDFVKTATGKLQVELNSFLTQNNQDLTSVDPAAKIENKLKNIEITSRKPVEEGLSAFGAEFVTLADGSIALLKPIFTATTIEELTPVQLKAMEDSQQDRADWVSFLRKRSNGLAEVAAYEVDKKLGSNKVPVTVLREIDGVQYTLQAFSESDAKEYFVKGDKIRYKLQDLPISLSFFDTLIGHIDRHNSNYLTKDGVVVAIDNGASFSGQTLMGHDMNLIAKRIMTADYGLDKEGRPLANPLTAPEIELLKKAHLQLILPDQQSFANLESFSEPQWRQTLTGLVSEKQIELFLDRRLEIIETVRQMQQRFGPDVLRSGDYSPLVRTEVYREKAIQVPGKLDIEQGFKSGQLAEHPLAFSIRSLESTDNQVQGLTVNGDTPKNLLSLVGSNLQSIRNGETGAAVIEQTQKAFLEAALSADRIFNQSFVIQTLLQNVESIQSRPYADNRFGANINEFYFQYPNIRGEMTQLSYPLPNHLTAAEAKEKMQGLFEEAMTDLGKTVDQTADLRREFNLRLQAIGAEFDHDGNLSFRSAANDSSAPVVQMVQASESDAKTSDNLSSPLVLVTDSSFDKLERAFAPGSDKATAIRSLQDHIADLDQAINVAKEQLENTSSIESRAIAKNELDFAQHVRRDLESAIKDVSQWKDRAPMAATSKAAASSVKASQVTDTLEAEIQSKLDFFKKKLDTWQTDLSTMDKFDEADLHAYAVINYEAYKAAATYDKQEFEVIRTHLSRALMAFEERTGIKVPVGDAVFQLKTSDRMKDFHQQIKALEKDPVLANHPRADELRHAIFMKKMESLDGAIKNRFDLDLNKPEDLARLEQVAGKRIFNLYTEQSQRDLSPQLQLEPENYLAKVRADVAARQQLVSPPIDHSGAKQLHMVSNYDVGNRLNIEAQDISTQLPVFDPHAEVDPNKVKAVRDGLNAKVKVDPKDGTKPDIKSNEGWNFVSKVKVGYDKVVSEILRRTTESNRQKSEANFEMYGNLGEVRSQDNSFHLNESMSDLFRQLSVAVHEMAHVATNDNGLQGNSRQIWVTAADKKIGLNFTTPQGSYNTGFRVDEVKAHLVQSATDINSIRLLVSDLVTVNSAEGLFNSVFGNANRIKNFVDLTASSYSQAEQFVEATENLQKKKIHPDEAEAFKDVDVYRIPILGPNTTVTHYLDVPVQKGVSLEEAKLAIFQTIQAGIADLQNLASISARQNEYAQILAHIFKDAVGYNPFVVIQAKAAQESYNARPLREVTEAAFNTLIADASPKLKLAVMKKELVVINEAIVNTKKFLAGVNDLSELQGRSRADTEELKRTLTSELGYAANARSRLQEAITQSTSEATLTPTAANQFKPKMDFAVKWTHETAETWIQKLSNPTTMTYTDFKKLAVEFSELKSQIEILKTKDPNDPQVNRDHLQTAAMKARVEQLIANIDMQINASDASYSVASAQGRLVRLNKEDALAGTSSSGKIENQLNSLAGYPQIAPQLTSLLKYMPVLESNSAVNSAVQFFALHGANVSVETLLLANQATSFDISELRNRQYFDKQAKAIVEASIKVSNAFDAIRIAPKNATVVESTPAVAAFSDAINRQVDSLVPAHLVGGLAFQLQAAEFRVAVEYRGVHYDRQIEEVKRLGLPDSQSLIERIYEQKISAVESEFLKKYPQAVDANGHFDVDKFISVGMSEDVGLYGRIISSNLSVGIRTTEQITKYLADIREKNAQPSEVESRQEVARTSTKNLHLVDSNNSVNPTPHLSASKLNLQLSLFQSLTQPKESNVQFLKGQLENFNSGNQMKLMVDEINRIYNSNRVEFKSDAEMADAGGSVGPGQVKMNINESGKDPFGLISVARHESVHTVTNAQGIAGNARQISLTPSLGGKIRFLSGDESYSSFLRMDEIRAHMMNVATDVGTARLLMTNPATVVDAQTAFARANMNMDRLGDFYSLSVDSLAKAEKALLYSEQLPNKVLNLDGSPSITEGSEFYSIPITTGSGEVIFMTVPVKAGLSSEETLKRLIDTVQAAKNDVGNSLSTSIKQKQYLQMLEAVYTDQTGVEAHMLRPSRIDSDKIEAVSRLRGENPTQQTTRMAKEGSFNPIQIDPKRNTVSTGKENQSDTRILAALDSGSELEVMRTWTIADAEYAWSLLGDQVLKSTTDALVLANIYLGPKHKQESVSGYFVSADGTRAVRMTDSDLAVSDNHAGGSHMNFLRGKTEFLSRDQRDHFFRGPKKSDDLHIFLPEEGPSPKIEKLRTEANLGNSTIAPSKGSSTVLNENSLISRSEFSEKNAADAKLIEGKFGKSETNVGDFSGLNGANLDEFIKRVPSNAKVRSINEKSERLKIEWLDAETQRTWQMTLVQRGEGTTDLFGSQTSSWQVKLEVSNPGHKRLNYFVDSDGIFHKHDSSVIKNDPNSLDSQGKRTVTNPYVMTAVYEIGKSATAPLDTAKLNQTQGGSELEFDFSSDETAEALKQVHIQMDAQQRLIFEQFESDIEGLTVIGSPLPEASALIKDQFIVAKEVANERIADYHQKLKQENPIRYQAEVGVLSSNTYLLLNTTTDNEFNAEPVIRNFRDALYQVQQANALLTAAQLSDSQKVILMGVAFKGYFNAVTDVEKFVDFKQISKSDFVKEAAAELKAIAKLHFNSNELADANNWIDSNLGIVANSLASSDPTVDLQIDEEHIRHSGLPQVELRDGSHHIEALSVQLQEVQVVGNSDGLKVFDNQNARGENFLTYSYMVEVSGQGLKIKTSELPIDKLTGTIDGNIPSGRTYFEMRMQENPGSHVGFIDVGSLGFVNRNYTFGVHAGDVYLAAVADVIKSVGGDKVIVMKNGGDEFAILILEKDPQKVQALMQKISDSTSAMDVHQISLMENALRAEEFQKAQYRIEPDADPNALKTALENESDLGKREQLDRSYQEARTRLFASEEFKNLAQAYKQNYIPYSRESLSMGATQVGIGEKLETVLSRGDEAARLVKVEIKEAVFQDATKQRGNPVTAFDGEFGNAKDLPKNKIFNPTIPLPIEAPSSVENQRTPSVVMPYVLVKLDLGAPKLELTRGKEVGRFAEFSVAEYTNELGEKTFKVETYFDILPGQRQVILHEVGLNSRTGFLDANTDQAMEVLKAVVQEKPGIGVVWVDVPVLGLVNYFKDGQKDGDALLLAAGKAVHSIMRDENIGFKFKGSEFVVEVDKISAQNIEKVQQRMIEAVITSPEVMALFAKQRVYLEAGLAANPNSQELIAAMETLAKMESGETKIVNVLGTVTQKGDTITSVLARTRGIAKPDSSTGIEEGKATPRSGIFEENIVRVEKTAAVDELGLGLPEADAMAVLQKVPNASAHAVSQNDALSVRPVSAEILSFAVKKVEAGIKDIDPNQVIKKYEAAFNEVRNNVRRFEIVNMDNRYGAATIGGRSDSLVEIAGKFIAYSTLSDSMNAQLQKKNTLKDGSTREFVSVPQAQNIPFEIKEFDAEALPILGHEFAGHVADFRAVIKDPTQPFLIKALEPVGLPVSYPTAVFSELNGFVKSSELLYQAYLFSMKIGDIEGAQKVVSLYSDVITQIVPMTHHFQQLMEMGNTPESQAIISKNMYFSTSRPAHSDQLRVAYFSIIGSNGKPIQLITEVPETTTDIKTSTAFVQKQLKNGLAMMPTYQSAVELFKVQAQAIAAHFAEHQANAPTMTLPKVDQSNGKVNSKSQQRDFDVTEPGSLEEKYPIGIKPDSNMNGRDHDEAASFVYERKAGQKLAKHGYVVRYSSDENLFDPETRRMVLEARRVWGLPHNANFDLLVEGKPFDVYAPKEKTTVPHMVQSIKEKSETQTGHLVLYAREGGSLTDPKYLQLLRSFLREGSMNGQLNSLQEVLVVQNDGSILRIFPAEPPRRT